VHGLEECTTGALKTAEESKVEAYDPRTLFGIFEKTYGIRTSNPGGSASTEQHGTRCRRHNRGGDAVCGMRKLPSNWVP
jgi:hypothetical protein